MTAVHVQIQRLQGGAELPLPAYETPGAAGLDLRAAESITVSAGGWCVIPTGIAIALPLGYEAQVRPRSGLAVRFGVTVLNAPGTIDSDYRGEIKVPLINHGNADFAISRGDRIAQLVVSPITRVSWVESQTLDATHRGHGGFGSSGMT